jgi:polyribonucleotide nucleotidyltransferase
MIIREKVRIGDQLVTLETGRIAKQAGGSCLVRAGDTIVLVTVVGSQDTKPGQSFFPLSVDYQEKTYAAGKIPGGFFKREGRLRDYEILVSRLIDRPCRPLFPEGYLSEVQVIATVMSFDQVNPPDVLAMVGASAALHMSAIPWKGPIAGVRVGRVDGKFVANPTFEQIALSDCDLIVAASRDAIVMVEGEADEISEEELIEALLFGHNAVQGTLDLIDRMQQAVGKPKWRFSVNGPPVILQDQLRLAVGYKVREACSIADKQARSDRFKQIRKEAIELLAPEFPGQEDLIKAAYEELRYSTMRSQVLDEGLRLDGRDTRTVRPISIELGVLPRVHGSSLFTRGETQAIVTSTLGTARDSQRLDTLSGDVHKNFLLHYNFPPYSVGEVKPMRGPGRREVGHGNLAERALAKMMPSKAEFPYTVRIVSEITESNGSSSMASVCGGSLALMDAGVPIKSPVAGVAMGLIKEGPEYAVLTDILGDEDALGDMDFKVCGTEKGVTAIQMDIKVDGLSREILERALLQAREARLHILDKMQRAIPAPRPELSAYAPRITQIRVKPDQVRTIIGPGGKMIRAIVDQTGASIDVEDDGTVSVSSADSAAVLKALEIIKSLTTDPEIGEVYEGTVKRIEPYGAFIEILPGKDGLCHISDIDFTHVTSVEDYVNLGDKVTVKVTNIDRDGRIRLSRKDALAEQPAAAAKLNGRAEAREERPRERDDRSRDKREDRPRDKREDRPRVDRMRVERDDRPRDDRPRAKDFVERDERPAAKVRDLDRDLERPVVKARDLDRDLDRPVVKSRDLDLDRPVVKPRDLDLDRPVVKPPRDLERDLDRPAVKPRDLDRDLDRPVVKPRDLDRDLDRPATKPRDLDRDLDRPAAKPRDLDRDLDRVVVKPRERDLDRPAAKVRDLERDERPAVKPREFQRDERPARTRDFERDERPVAKARDLERDERPARARDFERDERPVKLREPREERAMGKTRDFERDERPAVRDFEADERPVKRDDPRDLRPAGRTRDFERDPRASVRDRELDRGEVAAAPARLRDDTRPAARLDEPRRDGARRDGPRLDEPRVEARGSVREQNVEARGSAREQNVEARGSAREQSKDRGAPELVSRRDERPRLRDDRARVDARGPAREQGDDDREVLRSRPRDDEREERPARRLREDGREDVREPRPREERDFGRARAGREPEREPRPIAKLREVEQPERPVRRREAEFEAAPVGRAREVDARGSAREQNLDREAPAGRLRVERDERVAGRAREDREARPRLPEDESLPRRRDEPRRELGSEERGARPRREDRFEPRSARRDEERPRTRDSEPPLRPATPAARFEDDRLYDDDAGEPRVTVSSSDRGDRTERERPSRTRERARNRERVRELERERR